jgi:hypothetical protein
MIATRPLALTTIASTLEGNPLRAKGDGWRFSSFECSAWSHYESESPQ